MSTEIFLNTFANLIHVNYYPGLRLSKHKFHYSFNEAVQLMKRGRDEFNKGYTHSITFAVCLKHMNHNLFGYPIVMYAGEDNEIHWGTILPAFLNGYTKMVGLDSLKEYEFIESAPIISIRHEGLVPGLKDEDKKEWDNDRWGSKKSGNWYVTNNIREIFQMSITPEIDVEVYQGAEK